MFERNDITQSLGRADALPAEASLVRHSLDMLTSAIIGALIAERLIDYAGQPGTTIEYAATVIAKALLPALDNLDTVEMNRFWDRVEGGEK